MSRVFKNKKSWWIDYENVQGVRRREKIGPDKRIAQECLDDILGKVARKVRLGISEESKISFADFANVWKKRVFHLLAKGTRKRWDGIVEDHLKKAFPGSLRSIAFDQVEEYQRERLETGASPYTVNKEITVLKHMISRAVTWKHDKPSKASYLMENRIKDVKFIKEPPGRTRWLTAEEIDRLLTACTVDSFEKKEGHFFSPLIKGYLKPFVLIALNTGMRRGEILSLTRKDIDWKNRIITIEHTKNGEKRHVYLNDVALMVLKALPRRIDNGKLFPFRPDQIGIAFWKAVKRAEIEDFRFHDLRHTFCSHHAMSGTQGRGLMALMGHKDTRMTSRYSHLSDTYLREKVNHVVLGLEREIAFDEVK